MLDLSFINKTLSVVGGLVKIGSLFQGGFKAYVVTPKFSPYKIVSTLQKRRKLLSEFARAMTVQC